MAEWKAPDMAIQQLPLGAEPVKRVKRGMKVLVRSPKGGIRKATISNTEVSYRVSHLVDVWVRYDSEPAYEQGAKLENVYTCPEGG